MDQVFPLGLPSPTAFYLVLYLATLLVHIVFMNYVLAGSAYVVATTFGAKDDAAGAMLRDWMPFMLSAAITAGIAPLLFLQVLYKEQFYSANLLLSFRWMAVLPALIFGFYLSYLVKAKRIRTWKPALKVAVVVGVFACFAFVAWSFVENHLLSVRPAAWAEFFASKSMIFAHPELLPRLVLWFVASFPTMALLVGWQLWYRGDSTTVRRMAVVALGGIVLTVVAAVRYFFLLEDGAQEAIMSPLALPYGVLTVAGGALQLLAWAYALWRPTYRVGWLAVASAGVAINFVGMIVVNESTRIAALDLVALSAAHEKASEVGGFALFVFFFVVNLGLMGLAVWLTRKR